MGRKTTPDKKVLVGIYKEISKIEKLGGKEKVRELFEETFDKKLNNELL